MVRRLSELKTLRYISKPQRCQQTIKYHSSISWSFATIKKKLNIKRRRFVEIKVYTVSICRNHIMYQKYKKCYRYYHRSNTCDTTIKCQPTGKKYNSLTNLGRPRLQLSLTISLQLVSSVEIKRKFPMKNNTLLKSSRRANV